MAKSESAPAVDTVLLDVDGTLIDSNYWHVAAWQKAFGSQGEWQPAWRIHRCIGMGGDKLVAAVAGDLVEKTSGDQLRKAWKDSYDEMISQVRAFPGASELIRELKRRKLKVVLASSGNPEHLGIARKWLDVDDVLDGVTTGEDAESSKPAPDIFELALEKSGGRRAVIIGDTPWDVQAADRMGSASIALRCGGFGGQELLDAGAADVFDDPQDLLASLDQTLLAG